MAFNLISQTHSLPYFVPDKLETKKFDYFYVLKNTSKEMSILKINKQKDFELNIYFSEGEILCRHFTGSYELTKGKIKFTARDKTEIIKNDTLTFAKKPEQFYQSVDLIRNNIDGKIFKKGNFFDNKIIAFFNKNPRAFPTKESKLLLPWYISPLSGRSMIQGKCSKPDDLDCLCTALIYDKKTDREKSDAIARFIIERFRYNDGDTSQKNVKGLVFGKEREAVCEGYSRVYLDLMTRAKLKAQYVSGAVRTDVYDIFYTGHSHAWNEALINGDAYSLDVTWANNTTSPWNLLDPEEMFYSHFVDGREGKMKFTQLPENMYQFMNQPLIYPIEKGFSKELENIDVKEPVQFTEGNFVLNFGKPMKVRNVSRGSLSYPFVSFTTEKIEAKKTSIAKSGEVSRGMKTKKLDLKLPEKVNYFIIDIEGIGKLHYVVIKGNANDFYNFLINHLQRTSPHSVALAFLACAKLNDKNTFNKLKPYISDQSLSFEKFMESANKAKIEDFKYATFNATRVSSIHNSKKTFEGFSFEFNSASGDNPMKIFIEENEITHTFYFKTFARNTP